MFAKDLAERYGNSIMPFLASLGVQGVLPNSNVWFVDKNHAQALDADDGVHGHSWDTPFATIAYAIARNNGAHAAKKMLGGDKGVIDWNVTPWWKTNNVICIAPGEYVETLTSLPFACTMIGCGGGWGTEGSVMIKSITGSAAAGSLIGSTLINLHFETSHASPVLALTTFNSSKILNCVFHNGDAATYGISIKTSTRGEIRGCIFGTGNTALTHGIYIAVGDAQGNKKAFGMVIRDNLINASTAGIYCAAEYLTGCTWIVGNVIQYPVKGIDVDTTTPLWTIANNFISASGDCIEGAQTTHTIGNNINTAGDGSIESP